MLSGLRLYIPVLFPAPPNPCLNRNLLLSSVCLLEGLLPASLPGSEPSQPNHTFNQTKWFTTSVLSIWYLCITGGCVGDRKRQIQIVDKYNGPTGSEISGQIGPNVAEMYLGLNIKKDKVVPMNLTSQKWVIVDSLATENTQQESIVTILHT